MPYQVLADARAQMHLSLYHVCTRPVTSVTVAWCEEKQEGWVSIQNSFQSAAPACMQAYEADNQRE